MNSLAFWRQMWRGAEQKNFISIRSKSGTYLLVHQGLQDNELYQHSEQISRNTQIIKQTQQ